MIVEELEELLKLMAMVILESKKDTQKLQSSQNRIISESKNLLIYNRMKIHKN